MSYVQAITLAIAVLGATLGLINTWHNIDKSRLKLRIVPKRAIPVGSADPRLTFCIEITNLSAFAVSIEEAGVFYKRTKNRGAIICPVFADGGTSWPRRLEPRSSVTVYSQAPSSRSGHRIKCAYARTQCGVTVRAASPALKQLADEG
jgi:hypothetical protein